MVSRHPSNAGLKMLELWRFVSLAEVGCALWLNWEKVVVQSTTIKHRYSMRTYGYPQKELHDTGFEKFVKSLLQTCSIYHDP